MKNEIAEQIEIIVNKEVYKLRKEDEKYKNKWFDLKDAIENDISHFSDLIKENKDRNLLINAMMKEGYLQCLISLHDNYFEEL